MDDGGGGSPYPEYGKTFVPIRYILLAKAGRFKRLAGAFVAMKRLTDNTENSYFNAGVNGAYYFRVESDLPDGIYLVAPDGSFDFDTLAGESVTGALETLATYCDTTNIPKWTELADGLTNLSDTLSSAVGAVESAVVCGLSIPASEIPAWETPNDQISVLFRWIKAIISAAEAYNSVSPRQMADYRVSVNRFDIPVSMSATLNGDPISFSFDLYLLI